MDLHSDEWVAAHSRNVVDTNLATTLGIGGGRISTVEHLLATLAGLRVDNAYIELSGPELPIMDGSAKPFAQGILAAGIAEQKMPANILVMTKKVTVEYEGRKATLAPSMKLILDCEIDFRHPLLSRQRFSLEVTPTTFAEELAPARTFGFLKDIQELHAAGRCLGGSIENAVVVDEFSILNGEGLRFSNEFVRHKMLDVLGDLSLFGSPFVGRYTGVMPGHALNDRLVKAVFADPSSYEFIAGVVPKTEESRALSADVSLVPDVS